MSNIKTFDQYISERFQEEQQFPDEFVVKPMSKVRNFAELAPNIGFWEFDFYDLNWDAGHTSHLNGRLDRHAERALRPEAGQGSDEVDGNPVHLLRHPHGKRGAAGGQDRAESTTGGCLKQKYAHRKVLSRGNYASVIDNGQKIRPKRPE